MQGESTRARAGDLRIGDVFADHRIEGVLGRGGMGVVYRATDQRLNRAVALKVIKPELSDDDDFRRRFRRESELAAAVRQPNVVTIYQAGDADGLLFVTMDLIGGADLRTMLNQRGRIDVATACAVTVQVAAALDAAHACGLVHRDVKPANILVASVPPLHVYLTDFGLTKRTSSQSGLTKTGLFVGTLDYAAPEQIKGWPVDARADVYALGCVLFEMLTGQPPFRRENEYATLYAHMTEPPPVPSSLTPGVPPALDSVVHRALAKEPDARQPSAGDFARAAAAAVAGARPAEPERTVATGRAAPPPPVRVEAPPSSPTTPLGPPPPPPSQPTAVLPPRRSAWPVALLVAAVVAIGAAIAVALITRGGDGGTPPSAAGSTQQQAAVDPVRDRVVAIGDILDLSGEGRTLTQGGDFNAAARNRQQVLARIDGLSAPADLAQPQRLLRQAIFFSLVADQAHASCGTCPRAANADRLASLFKRRFVVAFNPLAQRYLQRSFQPSDI